jgi:4-oxalocrotonate tautomerase
MTLVRITLRQGRSPQQLQGISAAVHQALVAKANVSPNDLLHVFDEVAPPNLIADPDYGGVQRSSGLVLIEITLDAGRSAAVKHELYTEIGARLRRVGIRPNDVVISLVEARAENWWPGQGIAP